MGVNSRARRDVVRESVMQHHVSVFCLVETKVDVLVPAMAVDLMGTMFDYVELPAIGVAGGVALGWSRNAWSVSRHSVRQFTIAASLEPVDNTSGHSRSLAVVYGPVDDGLKPAFLDELRLIHAEFPGS